MANDLYKEKRVCVCVCVRLYKASLIIMTILAAITSPNTELLITARALTEDVRSGIESEDARDTGDKWGTQMSP